MTMTSSGAAPLAEGAMPSGKAALRATYRLQLRGGVGFREAEALVPYLAALGVSHVYCSPYVEARAGSTHGYDVVDPRRLDPALGDERNFLAFVAALRAHGMGQILDWVPNHVGIALGQNPWWQELLAFGPTSPYADFFDIDWAPGRPELRGKVLLPVLADRYGDVLERGELVPLRDADGGLAISYFDHRFPVSPASWGRFLTRRLLGSAPAHGGDDSQAALRRVLSTLSSRAGRRELRVKRALSAQRDLGTMLANEPALRRRVDELVDELRGAPGRPASFDALHRLLEAQHYRLAFWRVAADEINYRRFFDINELAAVRMECAEVFDYVHESVFGWIDAGHIDGLRIDHVDGLADPGGYCERIRRRFPAERLYLIVEKILGRDERLPESWGSDGTSGYEFLNLLNGLFVDPSGEEPLTRIHRAFTGETRSFDAVLRGSKRRVMRALLASELDGLASALDRLAQGDRHTRDFTRSALREALADVVAAFPVYRSYAGTAAGARDEDRGRIAEAVAEARERAEDPESGLYEWLESALTGDLARRERRGVRRRELLHFVSRFEQYTAPVMAKGLEDTSFYRHVRLLSLNEVGGDPRRFGVGLAEFHAANLERSARFPRAMLATSTHDTKRGEDVRARLNVLSELPSRWEESVRQWASLDEHARRTVDGERAPARKDEYLLYQTLVGSFPAEPLDAAELSAYCERVQRYAVKALREGKERSSWRYPRTRYEQAVVAFIADLLTPGSAFMEAFLPFQSEIATVGALNGLAQLVLKLTAPGVPDIYQGCEGWDFSLADPDNRRAVDFAARRVALEASNLGIGADGAPDPTWLQEICGQWRDGRIKLFVTSRLLAFRRERPELFADAGYVPLVTVGERASHLCAFARTRGHEALLVIAPRLCASLPREAGRFPLGQPAWDGTVVRIPQGFDSSSWRDVLSGASIESRDSLEGSQLEVSHLFERLPLAVVVSERMRT